MENGALTTLAWGRATGGALTAEQKRELRGPILRGFREFGFGMLTSPLHRTRRDLELPEAPDTKLARTAEEAAREQPESFLNHGYRTWLFGSLLAQVDGNDIDNEYFYVASILHDSGLAESVAGEDFTIRSAVKALGACRKAGIEESDAIAVTIADAIVAHFTPGLEVAESPIGYYVQAGALADLLGSRSWEIANEVRKGAYLDHPSHNAHGEIPAAVAVEARAVPDGRPALLQRYGFATSVRLSPMRRFA